MYDAPGLRINNRVSPRVVEHGAPCVVQSLVGFAAKSEQLDRWVDPSTAGATSIAIGEPFVLFVGGIHEIALEAPFAAAGVDDLLYIDPADDGVDDASATGLLPLGVIIEVDAARTPDVARVLCGAGALNAFMAVPAP